MEKTGLKLLGSLLAGIIFLILPGAIHAASFGFSPSTLSPAVGENISVTIYVSSPDEAMNAASGTVTFPTNLLEVASVTTSSQVIDLWVRAPTFSNTAGTINFEGGAFSPGYTGSGGSLVTITFTAKEVGQGTVSFSKGSILANDGLATEIYSGAGSAAIAVHADAVEEVPEPDVAPTPTKDKPTGDVNEEEIVSEDQAAAEVVQPMTDSTRRLGLRLWEGLLIAILVWLMMMSAFVAGVYYGRHTTSPPPLKKIRRR